LDLVASELNLHKRQVERICWRESIWGEIDKIRSELQSKPPAPDPADWLSMTRAALRGPI